MSKGEMLRRVVTDRLAAAAQEILAVVERTVAGYEEEASGLRLEVERQRRQLEALLRPEVQLDKTGARRSGCLGPAEEEEGEGEESPEHPAHLEDSSTRTPPRWPPPRGQCERRKPGRPQISDPQTHVDLRIRILPDPRTEVLSNSVLKRCATLKLKVPRGLQQEDFLGLLRSSSPQLSGGNTPFDILTADKRRRLQPLKLKTLTPEEIRRRATGDPRCSGRGGGTLYIRLKTQKKEGSVEESRPRQAEDDTSATTAAGETRPPTSSSAQEGDGSGGDVASSSSTSHQQQMETEEVDAGDCGRSAHNLVACSAAESKGEGSDDGEEKEERQEANDSGSKLRSKTKMLRRPGFTASGTENREAALTCRVCGKPPPSLLSEHVAAHSGGRPYECDACRDEASLEKHQKLHEAGKLHKCYTCHKVFGLKEELKAHRRTHANKKTHLCGVCGKSLSDFRSLSRHKMTHSGERPHSCQICGRRFKLPGTLRQHEKIHTDRERSYLCDVCCKMFLTSKQLQIHMRTHTNEKPYRCGECGKGFTTKGPLTVHMRVHTGETPYRCPDCGWSFKRKINLDNHVTVHSGLKPFVCGICGKACARKTYLTVHMRTHNGERPYKCSLCDRGFTQSHCLKTHMKSHLGAGAGM